MKSQLNAWESVYTKQKDQREEPQKEVITLHDLFQNNKVQKILDLGCGGGRHLVYFAKLGYRGSGIDLVSCFSFIVSGALISSGIRISKSTPTYARKR